MSCHVTSFIIETNKPTRTKPAWTRSFPKPTQCRAGQPGAVHRDAPAPFGPARIASRLYLPHSEITTIIADVSWVGFPVFDLVNFRQNKNNKVMQGMARAGRTRRSESSISRVHSKRLPYLHQSTPLGSVPSPPS